LSFLSIVFFKLGGLLGRSKRSGSQSDSWSSLKNKRSSGYLFVRKTLRLNLTREFSTAFMRSTTGS